MSDIEEVDDAMNTSKTSVRVLGVAIQKSDIKKEYKERFTRVLAFFGYDNTSADLVEFLTLVIRKPTEFKITDRIIGKWRTSNSASTMLHSIISICNIPEIKAALGDDFQATVDAHELFIKHVVKAFKKTDDKDISKSSKKVKSKSKNARENNVNKLSQHAGKKQTSTSNDDADETSVAETDTDDNNNDPDSDNDNGGSEIDIENELSSWMQDNMAVVKSVGEQKTMVKASDESHVNQTIRNHIKALKQLKIPSVNAILFLLECAIGS